eukprot:703226-Amorphochlora_amoeboformis.AAC.1
MQRVRFLETELRACSSSRESVRGARPTPSAHKRGHARREQHFAVTSEVGLEPKGLEVGDRGAYASLLELLSRQTDREATVLVSKRFVGIKRIRFRACCPGMT